MGASQTGLLVPELDLRRLRFSVHFFCGQNQSRSWKVVQIYIGAMLGEILRRPEQDTSIIPDQLCPEQNLLRSFLRGQFPAAELL